jgi:uncharacterized repeat protein (TIGR01451 family)
MKIKQLFTLALAAGISATSVAETAYNLDIENNASLTYNVSDSPQKDIEVTAKKIFKVDRKVIFTLTQINSGVTPANIGTQQAVEYTLKNTSNAPIRFAPAASDLVNGEKAYGDTVTDNTAGTKITTYDIYYEKNLLPDGFGTGTTETIITSSFVELAQDETVSLYIVATPTVGEDLDIFVHNLTITAQESTASAIVIDGVTAGDEITNSSEAWDDEIVQTVLNTDIGGAEREDNGAIQVGSATLGMIKDVEVVSDPLSKDDTKAIAIPGAIVKYTLTVTNTGSIDATNVVITDTLPVDNFDLSEATHVEIFSIVDADGTRTPTTGTADTDVKVTSTVDDQILVFPAVKVSKTSGTAVITFTAQLK